MRIHDGRITADEGARRPALRPPAISAATARPASARPSVRGTLRRMLRRPLVSLRRNALRPALTALGIIIGIGP